MSEAAADPAAGNRHRLRADCGRCAGLCCVAPAFAASADFAVDKPAGQPCRNLQPDFTCGIHAHLRERGFSGCTVFDCFGAGQQVVQVTFGGGDWRQAPRTAEQMFVAFTVMRQLHELLWYLTEARALAPARLLHDELGRALEATEVLTRAAPDDLVAVDVASHRREVDVLLLRTSELVRAAAPPAAVRRGAGRGAVPRGPEPGDADGGRIGRGRGVPRRGRRRRESGAAARAGAGRGGDLAGRNLRGADLAGRNLRGADLRGANLRGAYLIAADLRDADLRSADLIGADLRAADLRGADLNGSVFLTQFQVNAAVGDAATVLPPALLRPAHWVPAGRRSTGSPVSGPAATGPATSW